MNAVKDPKAGMIQEAGGRAVEMLEGFGSDLTLQQCCKKLSEFSC